MALAKKGVDLFTEDGFELILVDTSGRHKQSVELFSEMQEIN